jgi:hypothetical protein
MNADGAVARVRRSGLAPQERRQNQCWWYEATAYARMGACGTSARVRKQRRLPARTPEGNGNECGGSSICPQGYLPRLHAYAWGREQTRLMVTQRRWRQRWKRRRRQGRQHNGGGGNGLHLVAAASADDTRGNGTCQWRWQDATTTKPVSLGPHLRCFTTGSAPTTSRGSQQERA